MGETTEPPHQPAQQPAKRRAGGAVLVAAGILLSRVVGLLRDIIVARFFGVGPHADVFRAALRAPNVLQNLLGEGTLSAAFIPIYSRMVEEGREEEAGRFAGAIFGLLLATAGGLSLLGVLLARPIVAILTLGFLNDTGPVDRYELAVQAVRIIFPMTGILVLSAWALGILNSHRRFFLPYVAPVFWNVAIIAALVWTGSRQPESLPLAALDRLLFAACWGALAGGLLQFLVQLPGVVRVLRGFRLSFSTRVPGVREALGAFGPVVAGRGIVQLSGYLDILLASFLIQGGLSSLGYAQGLYLLPISLFGMSVAASELPELSRLRDGAGAQAADLVARVRRSLRQIAFLNVPTFFGYLVFGFLLIGAMYRRGKFGAADNWLVYLALCGYSLGLLATTSSRLLQNTFYALGDTRTPARVAAQRVIVSAVLGVPLMLVLDRLAVWQVVGSPPEAAWLDEAGQEVRLGAVGLALASGIAAWVELARLRRALAVRVTEPVLPTRETGRLLALAAAAALPAALLWWLLPPLPLILQAALVVGGYAVTYLLLARFLAAEELGFWIGRFGGRFLRK